MLNFCFIREMAKTEKQKSRRSGVIESFARLSQLFGGVQKYRFVGPVEAHFKFYNPNSLKGHADLAINNNRYSYVDIRHILGIVDILKTFSCFKFWFFLYLV